MPSITVCARHVRWLPRRSDSRKGPLDDKENTDQACPESAGLWFEWFLEDVVLKVKY